MYRRRVAQIQHFKVGRVVFLDPPVPKVHMDADVVCGFGDAGNGADISVAYIVVVSGLHDLVTLTEELLAADCLYLIRSLRIHGISQNFI